MILIGNVSVTVAVTDTEIALLLMNNKTNDTLAYRDIFFFIVNDNERIEYILINTTNIQREVNQNIALPFLFRSCYVRQYFEFRM